MVQFKVLNNEVILNKELNEIDKFVIKVINILSKYVEYVIVSGYIAILFGRSRASEDVDIFIKELSFEKFEKMYHEFTKNGFEWVIEDPKELYNEYLKNGTPIGLWEKNFPLLRMDMKFPKETSQRMLFNDKVEVKLNEFNLYIANIESTIAYKEEIAHSDKDLLDAKHLKLVFEDLDKEKIKNYKSIFKQEFNK